MNINKNRIHTARFSELNKEQDKFINARITTPQTYDEIKGKGQATILKIASKGIVEKLLKRCEYYKTIITSKTDTIKKKNELIDLLAKRLVQHEPELFKNEFKEIGEEVEATRKEEVKTGIENEAKTELTDQEKEKAKKDNEKLEKERAEDDYLEDDPEPKEPEDIDDGPEDGPECGEGGDIDDIDDEDDKDKEDKDDEMPED